MNRTIHAFFLIIVLLFFSSGCRDIADDPAYKKPDWLPGKITEILDSRSDARMFREALKISGWDSIVGRSGLFTLFCPTDEAVMSYLNSKGKSKVSDLSRSEWDAIIRYHLIQDGWSPEQIKYMSVTGSYRPEDLTASEKELLKYSIAFKRLTRYINPVEDFYVYKDNYYANYLRLSQKPTSEVLKKAPSTYKYVPIFFKEYFDITGYDTKGYSFYFDREFDNNSFYYASSKVVEAPSSAENGFVYFVDKIVEPVPNLLDALRGKNKTNTEYSEFLDLFYFLPKVVYNETLTKQQANYLAGKPYDLLYDIDFSYAYGNNYSGFGGIDLDDEQMKNFPKNSRFDLNMNVHPTLIAPTNEAFNELISQWVTSGSGYERYGSLKETPEQIRQLITSSYVISTPVFKQEITEGVRSISGDSIYLSEDDILEKQYCSNGYFIGVKKPIIPRAFKSVVGPVILNPRFEVMFLALLSSKLIDEVLPADKKYTLFAIESEDVGLSGDSSIVVKNESYISNGISLIRKKLVYYDRAYFPPREGTWFNDRDPVLKNYLLNMISDQQIEGNARIEYLRTLGGNYIQVDNINKTVTGTEPTTYGLNGDSTIANPFVELRESKDGVVDNGQVFQIRGLLNFTGAKNIWGVIKELGASATFTNRFSDLMIKAGLADNSSIKLFSNQEFVTAFIPTDEAISKYETDNNTNLNNWSKEELQNFLKYHFVRGVLIFTDGKQPGQLYETFTPDKNSSSQINLFEKLNVQTSYDQIDLLDKQNNVIVTIVPDDGKSNIQTFRFITETAQGRQTTSSYTTGVVHSIDRVLDFNQ